MSTATATPVVTKRHRRIASRVAKKAQTHPSMEGKLSDEDTAMLAEILGLGIAGDEGGDDDVAGDDDADQALGGDRDSL